MMFLKILRASVILFIQNLESAELIKYANNSFFSMLISFSNEIANISEKIPNVDPFQVLHALVADKRITTIIDDKKIIPGLDSLFNSGLWFWWKLFSKRCKSYTKFC